MEKNFSITDLIILCKHDSLSVFPEITINRYLILICCARSPDLTPMHYFCVVLNKIKRDLHFKIKNLLRSTDISEKTKVSYDVTDY